MPDAAEDLELARSGDRAALARLLGRLRPRLEALAHARMGAQLRARVRISDILQSAYVEVLVSVPTFEGRTEDAFARWVMRVVENNIVDARRYFGAAKRVSADASPLQEGDSVEAADPTPSPSQELSSVDELARMSRALRRLPPDYRRAILSRIAGGSGRDTARALNRSHGAARVLLARARAALLVEMQRDREADDGS